MRVKEIRHNVTTIWADTAYIVAAPVVSCTNNVVTMTCSTSGATIRYSTDGGSSWSNYSSAITISATTTYKAYATKSDMIDSGMTTYTATYMQTVATPVVSCTNNVVTMTCSTSGATIRYSTDGGSSWSNYSSAITISATTTYKAYATKSGMIDSAQTSYTATYVKPTLPKPTVTVTSAGKFTIKTPGISGVVYHYATKSGANSDSGCANCQDPTTNANKLTGNGPDSTASVLITYGCRRTLKVMGVKEGYNNSKIACSTIYTC